MDIYEQMTDQFMRLPYLSNWDEVTVLFGRLASRKPYHWMLPVWACEGVGGSNDQAVSAAVSIACSQISIILVDDMLDSDPRGEYRLVGAPATANMACALQAAAAVAIATSRIDSDARLEALSSFDRMILLTTLGQYWDSSPATDEASYWQIVRAKSSPFFGSALYIGALLGGANIQVAGKLNDLGHIYGEMIQIHDDLNDAMEVPANPDWTSEHSSLPILFAQIVEYPEKSRFMELRRNALDPEKLAEAQSILIRCGAISYGIDQLVQRYQKCQELLKEIQLTHRSGLDLMLDMVIDPVKKVFNSLGMDQPLFPAVPIDKNK
jgi:geranylgeranyl pyrophosphate synthase